MAKKYEIEPIGNYVVLDLIEEKEKVSEGGIIMPETAQVKPQRALVVATGPGAIYGVPPTPLPMTVKPGDLVIVNKLAGQVLDVPGFSKLVLMSEGDILAILREVEESDE